MSASLTRTFAPVVPYIAVGVGLYRLHNAWAALLLYQLLMVVFLSADGGWHHARALLRSSDSQLVVVAALSLLPGIALYLFGLLANITVDLATTAALYGLKDDSWLPFILCFSFTNGWLEELYWRGYLGTPSVRLSRYDFWFGSYHALVLVLFVDWWWALAAALLLIGAAWLWRQVARISDGLLVNAVSHIGADLSLMLAIWALVVE